jgi:hypothetical protein
MGNSALVPVFIDEDSVVEAEVALFQQGLRGPVILRRNFVSLAILIPLPWFGLSLREGKSRG